MLMQHLPTEETKDLIRGQDKVNAQGPIRELGKAKVQVEEAPMRITEIHREAVNQTEAALKLVDRVKTVQGLDPQVSHASDVAK